MHQGFEYLIAYEKTAWHLGVALKIDIINAKEKPKLDKSISKKWLSNGLPTIISQEIRNRRSKKIWTDFNKHLWMTLKYTIETTHLKYAFFLLACSLARERKIVQQKSQTKTSFDFIIIFKQVSMKMPYLLCRARVTLSCSIKVSSMQRATRQTVWRLGVVLDRKTINAKERLKLVESITLTWLNHTLITIIHQKIWTFLIIKWHNTENRKKWIGLNIHL